MTNSLPQPIRSGPLERIVRAYTRCAAANWKKTSPRGINRSPTTPFHSCHLRVRLSRMKEPKHYSFSVRARHHARGVSLSLEPGQQTKTVVLQQEPCGHIQQPETRRLAV